MHKHIVKSLFVLLIVALAQLLPFVPSGHPASTTLAESQVERTERLFSACVAADTTFALVKSNKRVPDNSYNPTLDFCAERMQSCNAQVINAAFNRAIQINNESICSRWLLFCALLI